MTVQSEVLTEEDNVECNGYYDKSQIPIAAPRKYEIIYTNVLKLLYIHLASFYGLYLCFTSAKTATILNSVVWYLVSGYGITAGAHRLWAHKTYKAKPWFEFVTMLCNCISYQQTVIQWVRDHRLHHKYSDTDADPHNASRGFFYSHIGWLMVKKNDLVKERGKTIDISDVLNNPVLQFQKKYALPLFTVGTFFIPTMVPVIFFGEDLSTAWHINMLRYTITLNGSLLVNSLAHLYGYRPYDENILPAQNIFVSMWSGGEGFHNYHHIFPWDYRTAELGNNYLNLTTVYLDFFAQLGWVYDFETATPEMIKKKMGNTGDNTNCWGFKSYD